MLLNKYPLFLFDAATDNGGSDPAKTSPDDPGAEPEDDPQEGQAVPFERFKKLNDELKDLKAFKERLELEQRQRDREEEEKRRERQIKEGQWESLFKDEQRKRETAEREAKEQRLAVLRLKVGTAAGLPPELIDRLQGDSEEQLKADAAKLLDILPKRSASADAGRGFGANGSLTPSEEKIKQKKRESNPIYQSRM